MRVVGTWFGARNFAWDRVLIGASYLYLTLPVLIFLFGWIKLPFAVLVSAAVLFGTWKALEGFGYRLQPFVASRRILLASLAIVAAWVLLSGIDGFGLQNVDFDARNAIFRDLIQQPWPVRYNYGSAPLLQQSLGQTGALVYYFAFWLPCAWIGKVLGWGAANHALLLWTICGVFLSVLLMCRLAGGCSIVTPIVFIAWSGLDVVGSMLFPLQSSLLAAFKGGSPHLPELARQLTTVVFGGQSLEWWVSTNTALQLWQYSSFTTQLFWVFNQAIPVWVAAGLLLNQEDKRSLVHTYALVLLFAPLPAIGLLPFLLYKLAEGVHWKPLGAVPAALRRAGAEALSLQNTIPPACLGFVAIAFLGAQQAQPGQGMIWNFLPLTPGLLARYAAFCVLEFLGLGLVLLSLGRMRHLVVLSMAILLVLPLYRYGNSSDLVTRASIPALFVLYAVTNQHLVSKPPGLEARRVLLVILLLIGSATALHEIGRSVDAIVEARGRPQPRDTWTSLGPNGNLAGYQAEVRRLVLPAPEDTFFFRVLARP